MKKTAAKKIKQTKQSSEMKVFWNAQHQAFYIQLSTGKCVMITIENAQPCLTLPKGCRLVNETTFFDSVDKDMFSSYYNSGSKGLVVIEDMADEHVLNAINKARKEKKTDSDEYMDLIASAGRRGIL